MMTFFSTEFKNIFKKKSIWLALIIYIAAVTHIYSFILSEEPVIPENIPYEASHVFYYFFNIQSEISSYLMIFLPLLPLIVLGSSFISERRSSILSFKLVRMDINQYIHSKLISLGATAFLLMFIFQLLLFLGSMIMFPVNFPQAIHPGISPSYAENLYVNMPFLYVILIIINSALMASSITILSVTVSVFIYNRFVATFIPFVLFIGISIILMAFPAFLDTSGIIFYEISPLAMVGGYFTSDFSWWIVPLYWILLNITLYLLTVYSFKRQFKKEKLL